MNIHWDFELFIRIPSNRIGQYITAKSKLTRGLPIDRTKWSQYVYHHCSITSRNVLTSMKRKQTSLKIIQVFCKSSLVNNTFMPWYLEGRGIVVEIWRSHQTACLTDKTMRSNMAPVIHAALGDFPLSPTLMAKENWNTTLNIVICHMEIFDNRKTNTQQFSQAINLILYQLG